MCRSTRLGDQFGALKVLPYCAVPPARAARARVFLTPCGRLVSKLQVRAPGYAAYALPRYYTISSLIQS